MNTMKVEVLLNNKSKILKKFLLIFFSFLLLNCVYIQGQSMSEKKAEMLQVLKDRNIKDAKVLLAMAKVPRENFVSSRFKDQAYEDGPLPIGHGQTISQPYIVAYMTQELQLSGKEKVLEIGFGSGYQTAILAELAGKVYAIEIIKEIYEFGKNNLESLGYKNIFLKLGDGRTGWKHEAPFDCILVAAAPESLPKELEEQLKEGGRMVIPIGPAYNQILYTYYKKNGKLQIENKLPVRFVPLTSR